MLNSNVAIYGSLLVIAGCTSMILTPMVRKIAIRIGAEDRPGGRKIHVHPVPLLGGVSIVLALLVTIVVAKGLEVMNMGFTFDVEASTALLLGGSIIFFIGVYDDLKPVSAWIKFFFQSVAAIISIEFGVRIQLVSTFGTGSIDPGLLAVPLTFLWIVGLTNAFNLIDGLDGLAAGLGVIAAATSATILCLGRGLSPDALLLLILSGALIGFLRYNFHPASIFLGDSGSQLIGYILAVAAVIGSQKGVVALPVIIPLLVFGLPIFDTFLAMLRRAVKSAKSEQQAPMTFTRWLEMTKRMFEADRDHVHHRLMRMGLSHRDAVLTLYCLAAGLSVLAIMAVLAEYRNAYVILLTVILAAYLGVRKLGYEEIAFMRTGTLLRWCDRVMSMRLPSLAVFDVAVITAAYWVAFALKYDRAWSLDTIHWYLVAFPFALVVQMAVFWGLGLYRGVWRAMGYADLLSLVTAVGVAAMISYALAVVYDPPVGIQAFSSIDGLLLLILVSGGRGGGKVLVHLRRQNEASNGERVLIYGAGRRGESILRELMENRRLALRPIGFLDDDPALIGHTINRVRVLGSSDDLAPILDSQRVSALIVSSHKIAADHLMYVTSLCSKRQIPVLRSQLQLEYLSAEALTGQPASVYQGELITAANGGVHEPECSPTVKAGTV